MNQSAAELLKPALMALEKKAAGDQAGPICSHEVEVEPCGLLAFLQSARSETQIYWSERDSRQAFAGLGRAMTFSSGAADLAANLDRLENMLASTAGGVGLYGGLAFPGQKSYWRGFNAAVFHLPLLELIKDRGRYRIRLNVFTASASLTEPFSSEVLSGQFEELHRLVSAISLEKEELPPVSARQAGLKHQPDEQGWHASVDALLAAIDRGELTKAVLSRKTTLQLDRPVNLYRLLYRLKERNPNCYRFLFKFTRGIDSPAFFGASPELLYHRAGQNLSTEALAGTRIGSVHKDPAAMPLPDADNSFSAGTSDKDLLEHNVVADYIEQALAPLSESFDRHEDVQVRKLWNLEHLLTPLAARLKAQTSDRRLLEVLHPTPAVGGQPLDRALEQIRQTEQFERGWYCGAVGRISHDETLFSVAIRSGLAEGNALHLFSGAGIVAGSEPASEWDEIEGKIRVVTSYFV